MPPDFSHQNLQGHNFQGRDLSGCNFSQADLRGANFTQTSLRNANLAGIKTGLSQQWQIGHFVLGCLAVASFSAIAVLLNAIFLSYFWQPEILQSTWIPGVFVLLITPILAMVVSTQGLTIQAIYFAGCAIAIGIALLIVLSGTAPNATALTLAHFLLQGSLGSIVILFMGIIPNAISITYASMSTLSLLWATAIAIAVGSFATVLSAKLGIPNPTILIASNCTIIVFSSYIAWQSLHGEETFSGIQRLAARFAVQGGTCFCGSDLTEANFSSASLKNANFANRGQRTTTLTRVLWTNVRQLEYAYFEPGPLSNATIRQLLVSRNGYKGTFAGMDLRGVNLNGANLNKANLKRTNLSGASLRRADLRQAALTGSLAIGADFTGAQLAGANLTDWMIDAATQLDTIARPMPEPQRPVQTKDHQQALAESLNGSRPEMLSVQEVSLNPDSFNHLSPHPMPASPTTASPPVVEQEQPLGEQSGVGQPALSPVSPSATKLRPEPVGVNIQLASLATDLEELYKKIINFAQNVRQFPAQRAEEEKALTLETIIQQLGPQNLLVLYEERLQRVEARLERLESSRVSDMQKVLLTVMRQLSMQPVARRPKIGILLSRLYQGIRESQDLSGAEKAVLLEQVKALAEAKQMSDSEKKAAILQKAERMFQAILQNYPETASIAKLCNKLVPLIWKAIEAQ